MLPRLDPMTRCSRLMSSEFGARRRSCHLASQDSTMFQQTWMMGECASCGFSVMLAPYRSDESTAAELKATAAVVITQHLLLFLSTNAHRNLEPLCFRIVRNTAL